MSTCRICGGDKEGMPFGDWVKKTFTDWDKLVAGDVICADCLFWFDERSEKLATLVGKAKPQRMRNYSHFVVEGEWIPLSKGSKRHMQELLLGEPFPELAAIAESGQKHIAFRATRNPSDGVAGWVQFEEHSFYVEPVELRQLLDDVEALYIGFSKSEIETGRYAGYRILRFGVEQWQELEDHIKSRRGSLLFRLALFLSQKGDTNGRATPNSRRSAHDPMAGDTGGLQEPLSDVDLAPIRGSNQIGSVHERPRQVYQLTLPEAEC